MSIMLTPRQLIKLLKLERHPKEGGFFAETYRSTDILTKDALPKRYGSKRSMSTCIYYLLTHNSFSCMHRLRSDEVFHFYLGDPVEMLQLLPNGEGRVVILGQDIQSGMNVQVLVRKNVWQGMRLVGGGRFALLGCTVAPGFEYEDLKIGKRKGLVAKWPKFERIIKELTL